MSANSPGDLNAEFQQIFAHYQQSVPAQLQTAKNTLRAVILPALLDSGVANVEAAYSGYGDSGAIDGVQYRDKSGVRVEREKIPTALTAKFQFTLNQNTGTELSGITPRASSCWKRYLAPRS